MEKRDLYDINGNLTGEKIPENRYIRVVLCFIQNSKGEFLIQKRTQRKDGKYGSTGGHPKSGESSIQGMCTEIQEEIGLKVDEKELELIYEGREDKTHVFFDIYYLKKDIEIKDLILGEDEVEFVEWDSLERIEELIKQDLFLKNHAEEVYRMIEIFKERGIKLV